MRGIQTKSHASSDVTQLNKVRIWCWTTRTIWWDISFWNKLYMEEIQELYWDCYYKIDQWEGIYKTYDWTMHGQKTFIYTSWRTANYPTFQHYEEEAALQFDLDQLHIILWTQKDLEAQLDVSPQLTLEHHCHPFHYRAQQLIWDIRSCLN